MSVSRRSWQPHRKRRGSEDPRGQESPDSTERIIAHHRLPNVTVLCEQKKTKQKETTSSWNTVIWTCADRSCQWGTYVHCVWGTTLRSDVNQCTRTCAQRLVGMSVCVSWCPCECGSTIFRECAVVTRGPLRYPRRACGVPSVETKYNVDFWKRRAYPSASGNGRQLKKGTCLSPVSFIPPSYESVSEI